jgi:hypothetical protein
VPNNWWSSLNNLSFSYSLASRCSRYVGISSILISVFFEVDGDGYNSGGTVSHGQARGWWGGSEGGMAMKNAALYTLYKSFKSKSYRKIFAPGLVFLTIPSFPFASPNM